MCAGRKARDLWWVNSLGCELPPTARLSLQVRAESHSASGGACLCAPPTPFLGKVFCARPSGHQAGVVRLRQRTLAQTRLLGCRPVWPSGRAGSRCRGRPQARLEAMSYVRGCGRRRGLGFGAETSPGSQSAVPFPGHGTVRGHSPCVRAQWPRRASGAGPLRPCVKDTVCADRPLRVPSVLGASFSL